MTNEVIELLTHRQSCARLVAPAPSGAVLERIFAAALRAPDHGQLRPWRYLTISGKGLEELGAVFVAATEKSEGELLPERRQKLEAMPLRAPMIVVGIACLSDHTKVPAVEQRISAGVGMGYMLVALQALGFAGMWRTGDMAYNKDVKASLGLTQAEEIVGFLYIGTPEGSPKTMSSIAPYEFVSVWPQ
ncbi:MAG: nitroreductase family protein [Hahellaceae bacterium]|nr:nitroreductase family protein [Hahellaceae bacterium]